jgi:hypothetical protein
MGRMQEGEEEVYSLRTRSRKFILDNIGCLRIFQFYEKLLMPRIQRFLAKPCGICLQMTALSSRQGVSSPQKNAVENLKISSDSD